jgi:Antibiotic biosynthesis monooxygenase
MTAYNIVRFRVKPGREEEFVDLHRDFEMDALDGMRRVALVDTGDGTYCILGEWESFDDLANARPLMIGMLDQLRDVLEEISPELGVTDPISGEAVLEMGAAPKPAARRAAIKPAKNAKAAPKRKAAAKKPARKTVKKPTRKAAAKKKTASRGRR